MKRISERESRANLVLEYKLKNKSIYEWLYIVSNSLPMQIKSIDLDNLLDRSDEERYSFSLGKIVSVDLLKEDCEQNGIDIVSIIVTYKDKPIVIGADLRTETAFITVRKSIMADIDSLEEEIFKLLKE